MPKSHAQLTYAATSPAPTYPKGLSPTSVTQWEAHQKRRVTPLAATRSTQKQWRQWHQRNTIEKQYGVVVCQEVVGRGTRAHAPTNAFGITLGRWWKCLKLDSECSEHLCDLKKKYLFVYLERIKFLWYGLHLNLKKLYDRKKKKRLSCDFWFRALPTPQLLHKAAMEKTWVKQGAVVDMGRLGYNWNKSHCKVSLRLWAGNTSSFEHIAKTIIINASKYVFMKLFVARDSGKQKNNHRDLFDCFYREAMAESNPIITQSDRSSNTFFFCFTNVKSELKRYSITKRSRNE